MVWAKGQQLQGGKYVIEAILGQGSFGTVYKARHTLLDEDVTLKTPNDHLQSDPSSTNFRPRELLFKEARILSQLSTNRCPYIVRFVDLFEENKIPCLAMNLIAGETLRERVINQELLSELEALKYVSQIGEALTVIHQLGMIHKGVSPSAIRLQNEKAVLLDFGMVQNLSSNATQYNQRYVRPPYSPPEQYDENSQQGAYTDVYALAGTLYFLLTGKEPVDALRRKFMEERVLPPKQSNPRISDRVNSAILKGMALNTKERPQTVREWLELLPPLEKASEETRKKTSNHSNLVVLRIEDGNFEEGFSVRLQIWQNSDRPSTELTASLPPFPEFIYQYRRWQSLYYEMMARSNRLNKITGQLANFSFDELQQQASSLKQSINTWLNSNYFLPIKKTIIQEMNYRSESIELLVQTDDIQIAHIPWHLGNLFNNYYPYLEFSLSWLEYEAIKKSIPKNSKKVVRNLLILRYETDIVDRKMLEEALPDTELVFLFEPSREQLIDCLGDSQGWDILCFSGHRSSSEYNKLGEIYINQTESLTIEDLKKALKTAIQRGLQLAIFNFNDGLELAQSLAKLNIPQVITMREALPHRVLHQFLRDFFTAFINKNSFLRAVSEARERLKVQENEIPCASWLPVVYRNPVEPPLTWQGLLQQINKNVTSERIYECEYPLTGHLDSVNSVAISPDGRILASGSRDKTIKLWNLTTGELLLNIEGHSSVVLSLAFSPDGKTLASASNMEFQGGTVKLWDISTGKVLKTLGSSLVALRTSCIAFSPDGQTLASGHLDAAIRLWHLGTGKVHSTLRGHGWEVNSIAFSSDGQILVSGGLDGAVKIWNWRKEELLRTLNRPAPSDLVGSLVSWFDSSVGAILSIAISPDGQYIVTGGSKQPIQLWNADTGELRRILTGHSDNVYCVVFSPTEQIFASASADRTVRIWNLITGDTLDILEHSDQVKSVVFSPDGQTMVSGCNDGTIKIWRLSRKQLKTKWISVTRWYVNLDVSSLSTSHVGQHLPITLRLAPTENASSIPLRIPASALELTVYIEAPGFHLEGDRTRILNVVNGRPTDRTLPFNLIPLTSGEQTLRVQVYPGRNLPGITPAEIAHTVRVAAPIILPNIPDLIDRRAIPDPQPDVMLYVSLEEAPSGQQLRIYLTCSALNLDRQPLDPLPLTESDLEGLRQAAIQAANAANDAASQDVLASLQAFGAALFDQLMPPRHQLRDFYKQIFNLTRNSDRLRSWLIVSDARAVLPWEMVYPYFRTPEGKIWCDDFLGSKFAIAHWIGRQSFKLASEVPLAQLNLTHYQQHLEELPRWLIALGGETHVSAEERSDRFALLQPGSPYYGLHVLRYAQGQQQGRITYANDERTSGEATVSDSPTQTLRDRRLDFHLKRPAIGLSFVNSSSTAVNMSLGDRDTHLEAGWTLPFMHAGATALVGSRFSVPPESDRLFFSTFYQLMRIGTPLGEAIWNARQQIRFAFPHRSDWLAYTYFGHPQCEPYRVRPARGFTLFESLNAPEDDIFQAGGTYQFRATYRSEAPVWHERRLRTQQMPLDGDGVSVKIVSMTGEIPSQFHPLLPITPGSDYQYILTLTMPDEETTLTLLVRFQKGKEELHTLMLNFDVVAGEQP